MMPAREESVVIAGFGGQGVLMAGKLLAETVLREGKEVIWVPAYGPEVRGGTCNCTVKAAEGQIGAVAVANPDTMLVLNRPSFAKYEPLVNAGGLLIINSSLVPDANSRDDLESVRVPASEVAEELGSVRVANMVILGALAARRDYLQLEALKDTLKDVLPAKHHKLIPLNLAAIDQGFELGSP